jgi:hypothetical protein
MASRVRLPQSVIDAAKIATAAIPGSKYSNILIFFSRFVGLDMFVELALLGYCALIHIKSALALFSQGSSGRRPSRPPGCSHLEMVTTINVIKFIAIGYKYNTKKNSSSLHQRMRARPQ